MGDHLIFLCVCVQAIALHMAPCTLQKGEQLLTAGVVSSEWCVHRMRCPQCHVMLWGLCAGRLEDCVPASNRVVLTAGQVDIGAPVTHDDRPTTRPFLAIDVGAPRHSTNLSFVTC